MRKQCLVTFDDVACMENLAAAWQEFIRDKRGRKDVQLFQRHLADELLSLHERLYAGRYRHGGYEAFAVNDPKPRSIHKASVGDRLLHHAIYRQLYPFFSTIFISDSFSCQQGKGVHRAVARFRMFAGKTSKNGTRTCWVLKCDIRKFFASIDHGILVGILLQYITDDRLLNLLARVIESFAAGPGKGLPLGNLTSQLFANVYLNELDYYIKHQLRIPQYVRYADDFVFVSADRDSLVRTLVSVQDFLTCRLGLTLHPQKVFLRTCASGVDFLGWVHFSRHRVLRRSTRRRMQRCVSSDPSEPSLQSYLGMLQHGNAHALAEELRDLSWLFSGGSGRW